jgi:transposase
MTLCLSVYAAIEFRLRQALILLNLTLPNQLGKQVKNPTDICLFYFSYGALYQSKAKNT